MSSVTDLRDTPTGNFLYVGLDIETTGTHVPGPFIRSELIQIGLYVDEEHKYVSDVGHRGCYYWEPKALEINGFTFERIENGPSAFAVDKELEDFILALKKDFNVESMNIIPVGKQVGSFDMQFVRKTLPLFHSMLGYMSVDINSLLLAQVSSRTFLDDEKKRLTEHCQKKVKATGGLHDALYDAELALLMFYELTA